MTRALAIHHRQGWFSRRWVLSTSAIHIRLFNLQVHSFILTLGLLWSNMFYLYLSPTNPPSTIPTRQSSLYLSSFTNIQATGHTFQFSSALAFERISCRDSFIDSFLRSILIWALYHKKAWIQTNPHRNKSSWPSSNVLHYNRSEALLERATEERIGRQFLVVRFLSNVLRLLMNLSRPGWLSCINIASLLPFFSPISRTIFPINIRWGNCTCLANNKLVITT